MQKSIGYWIDEKSSGKGLVTKAEERLTQFAFKEWKLNRIEIRCSPDNIASQMIPKKLGFKEVFLTGSSFFSFFENHFN